MGKSSGLVLRFFEGLILIDTLFDEDTLQRSSQVLLLLLREQDLQLFAEEVLGALHAVAKELTDRGEEGLLLIDDAAVGGDTHLAVGEGVEGVDRLVRGDSRG